MDAITLLREDHKNVKRLFREYEKAEDSSKKRELVDTIIQELSVHAFVEEQHFYPTVMADVEKAQDVVREGIEEHMAVKNLLSELETLPVDDEQFDAKVTVVIEQVEHHIEEEEGEMFKKVRDELANDVLQSLGDTMESAKATAPTKPSEEPAA